MSLTNLSEPQIYTVELSATCSLFEADLQIFNVDKTRKFLR